MKRPAILTEVFGHPPLLSVAAVMLVIAAALTPARAVAAAFCRMTDRPEIIVTADEGRINYIHARDRRGIAALGKIGPARLINGLSHFQTRRNTRYTYRLYRHNGQVCAMPTRIRVSLSLGRIDVYLARELRRGSCPYRVTLAHENRHVAYHRRGLRRLAALLRRELRTSAERLHGKGTDRRQAEAALGRAIEGMIAPLAGKTAALTTAFDRDLDSPANRQKEARRCQE